MGLAEPSTVSVRSVAGYGGRYSWMQDDLGRTSTRTQGHFKPADPSSNAILSAVVTYAPDGDVL